MLDIEPLGDRAMTIRLGDRMDVDLAARARGVAARLRSLEGVQEAVPGYATVTLFYDPAVVDFHTLSQVATPMLTSDAAEPRMGAEHVIPVRYDGPDLQEVAERTGLTVAEVIERHHSRVYTAYVIGFVPGWAYLGELDPALELPRRPTPRPRVAAGTVAIAGRQTGVYPLGTPGGWHLIGHTSTPMFDPSATPPALLAAGDRVRFVPASE
jgi:KipI family sensor histidine kinase inhibitor